MSNTTSTETRAATGTMRAITQRAYGDASALSLENIPRATVLDDDVLVRVRAAAINHADWVYTTGTPLIARLAFGFGKPREFIRGQDVAGVVEAVGANVTRLKVGDEVFAEVTSGAFAEFISVPEKLAAIKPANLSFEAAAAVPLAARTAIQALRGNGDLKPGTTVLVNGASGGVGTFAIQIAKALGAEVTAVASTRNAELVRSLGADHVIDYSAENFTTGSKRYDLVLDLIGNHSLGDLRRVLTGKGTLVLSSGTGGRVLGPMGRILRAAMLNPWASQTLRTFAATLGHEHLDELRDMIEAGKVVPAIDRTYPLDRVPDALRYFAEEHARGKIVITVQ
jgi:NADPH:quinone reductase-like Zn-dependent oxidoreductase